MVKNQSVGNRFQLLSFDSWYLTECGRNVMAIDWVVSSVCRYGCWKAIKSYLKFVFKAKMSIYYVRFNLHHLSIKRQNMYFSKYTLGNFDILQFKVKQYILNILGYGTELHCSARFQSTFPVLHHYIILFQGNIYYPFIFVLNCCLRAFRLKKKLKTCLRLLC